MTADPTGAGSAPAGRLERSPDAIRAALPSDRRSEFTAAYAAALDEARDTFRLDSLHEVIETWWCVAVLAREPGHAAAIERGMRMLAGEHIETYPVDLDALRRG